MRLLELFQSDKSQSYEWQQIKPTEYIFQGKNYLYRVSFLTIEEFDFEDYNPFKEAQIDMRNSYDLMFFAQHPRTKAQMFDVVDSGGDQIKVFATIIDIFTHFVNEKHPDLIRFSAKEDSRKRLYNRFLKLARQRFPSAKMTTTQVEGYTYYWMLFQTNKKK